MRRRRARARLRNDVHVRDTYLGAAKCGGTTPVTAEYEPGRYCVMHVAEIVACVGTHDNGAIEFVLSDDAR